MKPIVRIKKSAIFSFLAALLFLNISGCAPLIIGAAAGGLGVYAISKDTIQGDTDQPYDALWNAALRISRIRGTIEEEGTSQGYIVLRIDSSRVWIKLIKVTHATTRLRVSARKHHFPNLSLAQDMFLKITEEAGGSR